MKKILFLCVNNSARSQMAEGLARQLLPGVQIESAGSRPTRVNSLAIEVMAEVGSDISKQYSKGIWDLSPEFMNSVDLIIVLCEEDSCSPIKSAARRLYWSIPDPVSKEIIPIGEARRRFAEARDQIKAKLIDLIREQQL